jgi:hypothetical protein
MVTGLHIAEEYWLRFPAWVTNLSGRHISNPEFLTATYSPGAITSLILYIPLVF